MLRLIKSQLADMPHDRLLVFGQSMGGYAALKYGSELGADMMAR